jgi:hypothetical protein
LQRLARDIATRLEQREFCLVFEDELERCWPSEDMESIERENQINAFAKSHGWTVSVLSVDSGSRAIFRKRDTWI